MPLPFTERADISEHELEQLKNKYDSAIKFIQHNYKVPHERSCPNYCNKCNAEKLLHEFGIL